VTFEIRVASVAFHANRSTAQHTDCWVHVFGSTFEVPVSVPPSSWRTKIPGWTGYSGRLDHTTLRVSLGFVQRPDVCI